MSDVLVWSWLAFAAVVFASRRLRGERVTERAPGTWLGILVQALAFSALVTVRTTLLGVAVPSIPPSAALDAVESALGAASVLFATWSIWVLGRNWSVVARLVEDHTLVTAGPYRIVRHPIYLSMLGMLLATGLSRGNPLALLVSVPLFVLGTLVRVRFEEKLLAARFGEEFARWKARVPAFLPGAKLLA